MAYVEPVTVWAPKTSVRSLEVLYNTGCNGWSVARVDWEGKESIGIRWNGGDGPGIGNPQSRGNATWFILPDELQEAILNRVEELSVSGPGGLLEKYAEMANDATREGEAEEWSEGLIGDESAPR
ncbi:MAG: hypothetical protein HY233_08220 [Acidobacteriales bacterium]|nr:hypothetical protein [Candidatus Koribacter versatilis]MBI3645935.1 hypothetical protein [Terriglobales bacterium]